VDTSATANMTRAAVAAHKPLVYVNRHPDERSLPKGVVTVASNDIEAGQLQMRFLAEKLGGKGNVAIIMGDLAQNATHDRTEGARQVLKDYPGIKVVEQQSAEWQRNKGMDLTSNWLLAGTQFDAIVANNDEMAIGAGMALQQAGKAKGEVAIVGIDGLPDGLAAVKRGLLAASVFQDPKAQAAKAVESAIRMIKGEAIESEVWVPFELIKPEQVAIYEQRYQ
jgi:inositol transport system substrate-binding protein